MQLLSPCAFCFSLALLGTESQCDVRGTRNSGSAWLSTCRIRSAGMLPVYVQPVCPEPNLMWTPGYWAYSQDDGDYFWVAGAWVPAPYSGALWTPPYWGWNNGNYGFYDGYWGQTVGYYGGVNYGFGFGGIGFAGGEWQGGSLCL
jgi:hypothetical protein